MKKRNVSDWCLYSAYVSLALALLVSSTVLLNEVADHLTWELSPQKAQKLWDVKAAWLGRAEVQRMLKFDVGTEDCYCYLLSADKGLQQELQQRFKLEAKPIKQQKLPRELRILDRDLSDAAVYSSENVYYTDLPMEGISTSLPGEPLRFRMTLLCYSTGEMAVLLTKVPENAATSVETVDPAHPELIPGKEQILDILPASTNRADGGRGTLHVDDRFVPACVGVILGLLLFFPPAANGLQLMLSGWPRRAWHWAVWFLSPVAVFYLVYNIYCLLLLSEGTMGVCLFDLLFIIVSALLLIPFSLLRRYRHAKSQGSRPKSFPQS